MTYPAQHISVAINRPMAEVYAFACELSNLPKWASGLTPDLKITFAPKNPFGVLDHDVTLPTGETFYNPMRVVPNVDGSEITFILFRTPAMTQEQFEAD